MSEPMNDQEIDELLAKMPKLPWFISFDDAEDCGPHRHSGLAMVDTGLESDWPIARLCEWPAAKFIVAAPALITQLRAEKRCSARRDRQRPLLRFKMWIAFVMNSLRESNYANNN